MMLILSEVGERLADYGLQVKLIGRMCGIERAN